MSSRAQKKKKQSKSESESSENSSSDSSDVDYCESSKLRTRNNRHKPTKKDTATKKERPSRKKQQPEPPRRKGNALTGPISTSIAPKSFSEPADLEQDPSGKECRFIPFEEIKDIVLMPEKYMHGDESGITTLLPEYVPGDEQLLKYFGYASGIEKTELKTISEMSDEELMSELERVEKELDELPQMKQVTDDSSAIVAIPGFASDLQDSIAINADVRTFDWEKLGSFQKFDVILMDPPWVIASPNVTRGVKIDYSQLEVEQITDIPLHYVQENGFLFMWVIASQLSNGILMFRKWGYELVAVCNWIKVSKYGKYMPSHGYYVQHNKETVIIGRKGNAPEEMNEEEFRSSIIQIRGVRQSHKPVDLHEMIEKMFPSMMYLEIFARPHNLRSGWVSLGIELPT